MIAKKILTAPPDALTRRQALGRFALTAGTLAVVGKALSATPPAMKEIPGTAANQARTTLHYEADLKTTPQRIYDVLLDAKQFASLTGAPADIAPKDGSPFSLFGGMILGRNVELVPHQRIVQAWRSAGWPAGSYSIVKFEFQPKGAQTRLLLDHIGFAEGLADHLDAGWKSHYLEPLAKLFA